MIEKISAILRNQVEYSFLERKEAADWLESQEPVGSVNWELGLADVTGQNVIPKLLPTGTNLYAAPVDQSARIAELETDLARVRSINAKMIKTLSEDIPATRRAAIEQCASVVDWFIGCEQISSKIRALLDAPGKEGEA